MRTLLAAVTALLLALIPAHAEPFQNRDLIVTDGRPNAEPAPLILALHGFTGTGATMQAKTNFDELARRDGFVVAYPSGVGRRWNDGARTDGVADDTSYLTALIAHLVATGHADPARIYLAGHSNGGGMALRMACARPDLIAGIAVIAMTVSRAAPCKDGPPLPAFFFHGMQDPIVPATGLPPRGNHSGTFSLPDTMALWASRNRCRPAPETTKPDAQAATLYSKYRGCAAPLYLLSIADHGHEWPGAGARASWLQGPASLRVDAADVSWRFFKAL